MRRSLTRRQLLRGATRFGLALPAFALAGCGRSEPISRSSLRFSDYRALVCVYFGGGNDSYNLMVPRTPEKYALYSAARQRLAVPSEQLLALETTAADGAQYGLHPSCGELQRLFTSGQVALLANTGCLSHPTRKADYRDGRVPNQLFSHNDQWDQWQTVLPDRRAYDGWAGRIADLMSEVNGAGGLPVNFSLAGSNLLQSGSRTGYFNFSSAGPQLLSNLSADAEDTRTLRAAFDALRAPDQPHLLESAYASVLDRGIHFNELIARELPKVPEPATAFPEGNALADQLKMVARLIGLRGVLGVKRQIFFVSQSGFDTHANQNNEQPQLFQRVSQALAAFYQATVELRVADAVTTFTASEFGRTLTTNGQGSDHGWSSHHVILGGAVRGGSIYGLPPSLVLDGDDDVGGGRFIPQTAVDEYAATLARWFGIADGELNQVMPNLGRFASRDLGFMS